MSVDATNPPAAVRADIDVTQAIDRVVGALVEIPAAFLVVAEVVVLFLGVMCRYVFQRPLVWSDELASTQFIWLAMLGAVIAFRRSEHMRMTALVNAAPLAWRRYFDALALAVSICFLVLVLDPAIEFATEEIPITTPALEISNAWRAAALPVGIALMLLFGLLRLLAQPSWRATLAALGTVVASAAAFWFAQPLWASLGNLNLPVFFVGLVAALVFAGAPIAFAFGTAT
ncbi:MAG: TRAP transporter small permease, partial [Acidocella sp.]|nr:TRAP transporter small permease [Acidocella sp.]